MRDLTRGKRVMVWAYLGNARMHEAFRLYGDRMDTVGIFTFEVDASGAIAETGTSISGMLEHINRWPHIHWLLTIMNHGASATFTALRNNTNGAKDRFLDELERIMRKYPWCAGVDIDLERGGGYANKDAASALFRDIYQRVKAYDPQKRVNICLPGMTGVQGSVGGENWCVYEDLNAYCDTAAIMSYAMAWAGSAPGPISPRDWVEGIYNYATRVMTPDKVFMGLPAYGYNWRIHLSPADMGMVNRGVSNTYYAAQNWMTGKYNFTDDAPPQPFIPIIAYWDDYDKVPWAMPHVYDYAEGWDAVEKASPITQDIYNRRRYLTCYGKSQAVDFGTICVDRNGVPDASTGTMRVGDTSVTLGSSGTATYRFTVDQPGPYDIAVRVGFPFWDQNRIIFSLDGQAITLSEPRLWWPYWRKIAWTSLLRGVALSAGQHTLIIQGGTAGAQFHGFRVCSRFMPGSTAGSAVFALSPRSFRDVDGNMAVPDKGFRLTTEVLRRPPDSALIWYDDFRDETRLPSAYWQALAGAWDVWQDPDSEARRPYSQLEGSGQLAWKYDGFRDVHLRARIAFPHNGHGRAGVFCGDVFCCANMDTQCLELYQGARLLGSYAYEFRKTPEADIRSRPSMYLLEMRIRGSTVRVYNTNGHTLRFTASITPTSGYAGLRSDGPIKCELLRAGDAWTYEPYEAFDVTMPDGTVRQYGRIPREHAVWDEEFEVFTLTEDMEEYYTRSEDISSDYDFYHSDLLSIACGGDYQARVRLRDINVWVSRLFLGDADGFSILYYNDVDTLVHWANRAAYDWRLRGIAIWSLGQEDMRLWKALPRLI